MTNIKETPEADEEEDLECTHEEYEYGRCVSCGQEYEPDDFSGATPGDR